MMAKYDPIQSFSVHGHIPCYLAAPMIHFLSNYMLSSVSSKVSVATSCVCLGRETPNGILELGERQKLVF